MQSQSVVQAWVSELRLRHQGVLLTAVRGCDTAPKDDASKMLVRCLRAEFLNCHCGDPLKAVSFIEAVEFNELDSRMTAFLKNCDHYPQHYVSHLMHAAEIVGYKKAAIVGELHSAKPGSYPHKWLWFYHMLCRGLHLNMESEQQLDERLNCDETTFALRAAI